MLWTVKFALRFNRLSQAELMLSNILSILVLTSTASRLLPSNLPERGFHRLEVRDSLRENCAIELLRVMRLTMGALPRLSVLPFFRYSSTLNFVTIFFCFCCHSATNTAEALCTKGKQRWWQMVGEWQQSPNSPTQQPHPQPLPEREGGGCA